MEGKKYLAVLAQAVSFYYVGFPQIGRLVAAPRISSLKSDTRSENLPALSGLVFSWGLCLSIYIRFSIATSYSFDDDFCWVLKNSSPLIPQHTGFSIQALASGL